MDADERTEKVPLIRGRSPEANYCGCSLAHASPPAIGCVDGKENGLQGLASSYSQLVELAK